MTVEIDESKFGKRKYQRGRLIEGQWVLGGDLPRNSRDFLGDSPQVQERSSDAGAPHPRTRSAGFHDHHRLLEGLYDNLGAEGFQHLTVNHSYNFFDPTTGAHSNSVENLWWQIKPQMPDTHRQLDTAPVSVHVTPAPQRHRLICTVPIRCSAVAPSTVLTQYNCLLVISCFSFYISARCNKRPFSGSHVLSDAVHCTQQSC